MMRSQTVRVCNPHVTLTVDNHVPTHVARTLACKLLKRFHPDGQVFVHFGGAGDHVRCHTHLILPTGSYYAWDYGEDAKDALLHTISAIERASPST